MKKLLLLTLMTFSIQANAIELKIENTTALDPVIVHITFLDENIGKGKYLTFLTADHGAVHVAEYLKDNKIPAGRFSASRSGRPPGSYRGGRSCQHGHCRIYPSPARARAAISEARSHRRHW